MEHLSSLIFYNFLIRTSFFVMEVYEEIFYESRDFGSKIWRADCVYYRLKSCIFVSAYDLWIAGRKK